jgi:glycosyltransferase involved in cell wall biosynthesis
MPKLSILLPTYNGAAFLDEQIDSILSQTDPSFELLMIDDGSSDTTPQMLTDYAARDDRLKVVPSTGNRGQNARLAELLGHAQGDYVAISDQDDRWASDRNAILFDALGDQAIVFGRSQLIDADGRDLGKSLLETFDCTYSKADRLHALIRPMFSAHAMLMRRDAMGVEALFQRLPFDWLIALEAIFGDGLDYRDSAVTYHRFHDGNQHNNFHLKRQRDPLVSRTTLSNIAMFRRPERLKQFMVFDYLSRSPRIDRGLQRQFRDVANRCYTVWFSEWRAIRSDGGLRDLIMETVTPLAGSPEDLARFRDHIDVLAGPLLSRPVRAEMTTRYRLLSAAIKAEAAG